MSPQQLPHSTIRRGFFRFAILRPQLGKSVRVLAAALGLSGIAAPAFADPPTPTLPARPAVVTDTVMERNILAALDADPELRRVNLVVTVVDGVAVIGGPVASTAIAKRAEAIVRKQPDIKDVKNGCAVTSGPDPLLIALAEKMKSTFPTRPTMTELPSIVTGPLPQGLTAPIPPSLPSSSLIAAAPGSNTVVAQRPPLPVGNGVGALGAPVSPIGTSAPPTSEGGRDSVTAPGTVQGKLTAGSPNHAAMNDILTSAGNVKKLEARFSNLTIELNNGILWISGTSPKASDAWDLAEKLRQIPGVTRVVVGAMPGK
jgi:osmotically-inducible protein OsmY